MSSDAITFTNPKNGVTANYPFEASKIFSLELSDMDGSISVLTASPAENNPTSFVKKGDC